MTNNALPTETTVGIVGAGAMGRGIAQVAAQAGHNVLLYDAVEGFAEKSKGMVATSLNKLVAKGKFTQDNVTAILDRIQCATTLDSFAPCGLVIEAVVEDLSVKADVFQRLEKVCKDNTILATNTSSISVTAIAAILDRPDRFVGMHFFNPAPVMKLVEVVRGLATSDTVAQSTFDTSHRWGKTPVFAKSTPGFIVNRVARPFYSEAWRLLEEGAADAATIDALMRDCAGFRMGPFELIDLIGHDVNLSVTRTVYDAFHQDPRYRPSLMQDELVTAGLLGRKTGNGIYHYGENTGDGPTPHTASKGARPSGISVEGDLGHASTVIDVIRDAGLAFETRDGEGCIRVGETRLFPACGLSATEIAAEYGYIDVVTFDLAIDYATTKRIAIAKADQADDIVLSEAAGLFQALGKDVSVIDDTPGMIVMRILAMLANEAADAVHWQVGNAEAIDTAMQLGVNYPIGPLTFADELGPDSILNVMEGLSLHYSEDRYRASSLLRRKASSGSQFHKPKK